MSSLGDLREPRLSSAPMLHWAQLSGAPQHHWASPMQRLPEWAELGRQAEAEGHTLLQGEGKLNISMQRNTHVVRTLSWKNNRGRIGGQSASEFGGEVSTRHTLKHSLAITASPGLLPRPDTNCPLLAIPSCSYFHVPPHTASFFLFVFFVVVLASLLSY